MKQIIRKKISGFTFMEILVALLILSALTLAAVVNFMPVISKAKATEAQLQLEHVYAMEKNYFFLNSKYSTSFSDISYEPNKLATEGGTANYKIEITDATVKGFKATATAVVDFDADGAFNVWEVDQDKVIKEVTPD